MIEAADAVPAEKGIPRPPQTNGRPVRYPTRTMDVGDSFFVAGKNERAFSFTRLKPKRFSTRIVVENGERGVRVWRIA